MKYKVPRLSANDDTLIICKLYFNNGDLVKKGEVIADLESTKATTEITAEIDEKVFFSVTEGEEVLVGEVFAEQSPISELKLKVAPKENIKFTDAALKLINEHGLESTKTNNGKKMRITMLKHGLKTVLCCSCLDAKKHPRQRHKT